MRAIVAALSSLALLAACGDGYGGSPTEPYAGRIALTLSSEDVMTSMGDARTVAAEPSGLAPGAAIDWSSSAPGVATVAPTAGGATITAVDDGSAVITASSGASRATVTVVVRRRLASVVLAQPSLSVAYGTTMQIVPIGLDARNNPMPGLRVLSYASSDPEVLDVSPTGVVTPIFQATRPATASVAATLTKDEVAVKGRTEISARPPSVFDHAALMLTEYVQPTRLALPGVGISFLSVQPTAIGYTITWSALSGPATAVHLHGPGLPDAVADVLVDLGPTAGTTTYGAVTGGFVASDIRPVGGRPAIGLDSLVTLMNAGLLYVDVHTAANPGGELRGQLFGPFN